MESPFLFTVMPARSRTSCASFPLISFGRQIEKHQMIIGAA